MGELEQIIEQAILKHSRRLVIKQVVSGVARNVGETTCDVERENFPTLFDVRLNAVDDDLDSYFTVFPAEGSAVLVAIIENIKTEAVVIRCSEISQVKINCEAVNFNNGENGLVKIVELIAWMQKVYADLQTLKTLLLTSPVTGSGAPLAIVFNPSADSPEKANFEDTKIKH